MHDVKLQSFEGPLDLLVSLIEAEKLSINEVSLAEVTEQYIERIREQNSLSVAEASEFLLVAATLMVIKSRSLLPSLELTQEEKVEVSDLEHRIALYAKVREVSQLLGLNFGEYPIFLKEPTIFFDNIFRAPLVRGSAPSAKDFESAINDLLTNIPKEETPLAEHAIEAVMTLEDKIVEITERVAKGIQTTFTDIAGGPHSLTPEKRTHVIVSFLAMLELVKQGILLIKQERLFDEIHLNGPTN